mgnify:CR=1 FL=1
MTSSNSDEALSSSWGSSWAEPEEEPSLLTGASGRNWVSYGQHVRLADWIGYKERALLTDPQTSGGLLVACAPDTATEVLSVFLQQAFTHVSLIGELGEGEPSIEVF